VEEVEVEEKVKKVEKYLQVVIIFMIMVQGIIIMIMICKELGLLDMIILEMIGMIGITINITLTNCNIWIVATVVVDNVFHLQKLVTILEPEFQYQYLSLQLLFL